MYDEIADCGTASDTDLHWKERVEARLYKKGEIRFVKGAADSGNIVTCGIKGIGNSGELLIVPSGETGTLAFTAGEIQG